VRDSEAGIVKIVFRTKWILSGVVASLRVHLFAQSPCFPCAKGIFAGISDFHEEHEGPQTERGPISFRVIVMTREGTRPAGEDRLRFLGLNNFFPSKS
jgi:hypothetical protein